jgi:Pyridoxamine 5'-phosphate oxidase
VRSLDDVRALGERESGLAVAITLRRDGSPRASVVNAGVVDHPVSGEPVVAFVSTGGVHKLDDLRRDPRLTVVFRSGWEWIAVEGTSELIGPNDPSEHPGTDLRALIRVVYAAAAGGTPDEWRLLDDRIEAEGHTAVLLRPTRISS